MRVRVGGGTLLVAAGVAVAMAVTPTIVAANVGPSNSLCASHPSRVAGVGGIQWGQAVSARGVCLDPGHVSPSTNFAPPSPPYRGTPPLLYRGGPVAGTSTAPGQLTVTPVYWVPSGGRFSIPAGYETLINRFVADAAAASGKLTNVFSAVTQYTKAGGAHLKYKLLAGTPLTDTNAFPASGCPPDSGTIWADGTSYTECITNAQLLSEASKFTTSKGLPNTDLAHLYVFYLPEGVETCLTASDGAHGGSCSINAGGGFCGYHAFSKPLVADMNYAVVDSPLGSTCSSDAGSNTGGNQSPNGNVFADTEISVTSHEVSETITDPEGSAWTDSSGNEIGDDCSFVYGDSSSFLGSSGARYNQTINGHNYFVQEELSNQDYKATSTHAYACIQGEDFVAVSPATGSPGTVVTVSGGGFASSDTVAVSYITGLVSPPSVSICTATANVTGSFTCTGTIPPASMAGLRGAHSIVAKGGSSLRKPSVTFNLT